jgi:asparagine synthase (glutamine-hydrolysing)
MVSLDGAPPDARLLERMAQTLAFRGPDGTHITTKPGAGFCFTFLRTGPAPQCPSQPCSLDGRVWLLGDVRLDGRDDLRRKLEQHGDEIGQNVTDEELVLRAWHRWREDALPDLIGDYSFALWDAEARQLGCARDLMGARPFFYAKAGNRLYFSNTLNAIRCAPEISTELDNHFIGDFLLQGSCSYPARTAFRDISRLPAGHILDFCVARVGVRRFITFPVDEPLWLKREEEYVEQFRALLEQAVRERLPRAPTAIFMSGGLDSTSVAAIAIAVKEASVALQAYTIDCRPLFDDQEGLLAARVAEHLNVPITVSSHADYRPFSGWEDDHLPTPEPSQEPYWPFYLALNRRVAANARVVFNGYGGDGVLTGQTWPYLRYLVGAGKFIRLIKDFGSHVLQRGRIPPLRGGFRSRVRNFFAGRGSFADYPEWLAPGFEMSLCLRQRWLDLARPRVGLHPFYPYVYWTLNCGYWASIQECEDSVWTSAALESRAPLLDFRIQRFLFRVPPVPLCIDKELLRRAMANLLPEEIRQRPKTPLAGDPLALQIGRGEWSPTPLPAPISSVQAFIDWDKLRAILDNVPVTSPWSNLRPLLLDGWLKSIEKDQRLQ